MNCPDCDTPLTAGICPHCSTIQHGDDPRVLKRRVDQTRESHDYHIGISDDERKMMEQASYNYFQLSGRRMQIPPRLFSDLKAKGVSMKWMEADASLEQ